MPTSPTASERRSGRSSSARRAERSYWLSMTHRIVKSLSSQVRKAKRTARCPVCGKGVLLPADDITSEIDGYTFVEKGLRCSVCGEEFLPEEESQRTIRVARRLGIWGAPLQLRRKLSRSGRGTVLRIPADIERALGLKGDEEVLVSKAGKKIIIEVSP